MNAAALLPPALVLVCAAGYAAAVRRLTGRGDAWAVSRVLAAGAGMACVLAAVSPPIADHDELFTVHAVQHLLLGMLGPALLALSAPVTLALRVLSGPPRRALVAALHARPVRYLVSPPVAAAVQVASLYLLYLTPLYAVTTRSPLLHALLHTHLVLAGCLFSCSIAGLDPIPRRPGTGTRLLALTTAAAAHSVLAKLLYAGGLPAGAGSLPEVQTGAEMLYYGGDIVDVVLATAVMFQWYRRTGRRSGAHVSPPPGAGRAQPCRTP